MLPVTHIHIDARAPTQAQRQKALRKNSNPVTNISNSASYEPISGAIDNLVVATRVTDTIAAIAKWVPYLTPNSNILFLQNGMGMMDKVISEFWPEETIDKKRVMPHMYMGSLSHGIYKHPSPQWRLTQAGEGHMKFAKYPSLPSSTGTPINELSYSLLGSEPLQATEITYLSMLIHQYERLIINCCINSTTALLDCENGELLDSSQTEHLNSTIIKECIAVTKNHFDTVLQEKSDFFPQLEKKSGLIKLESTINLGRLIHLVNLNLQRTARNSSSMRNDLAYPVPGQHPDTEIAALNGWVAYWGRTHGLRTPVNSLLQTLILAKADIINKRESDDIRIEVGENI
ncbi:hypothetical protein NADFUDRAFT_84175 [Nadsonia fulvescens var. elongata DSM 6958]|uniref:2-dehydropantoate 2-reductase n=1 Tax=Nadsonia fulvescens var. elongata DSM 6958 TaxID=857566 RepID=A0A1E3PDL6_9ASCO|nr:hypothetical protein NADFUDRAFT_84175 [Nadsonia fulvescens var. elongata DSM 6958]